MMISAGKTSESRHYSYNLHSTAKLNYKLVKLEIRPLSLSAKIFPNDMDLLLVGLEYKRTKQVSLFAKEIT